MKMKAVPKALSGLASKPAFKKAHRACGDEFNGHLERFLTATMDEVRLTTSDSVVQCILNIIGLEDATQFRDAVLRREISGMIEYEKQRDHSSHTLYNYLLGWYFFIHSETLRDALAVEFEKRGIPAARNHPVEQLRTNAEFFGLVWQYASILHDIGYMFEGSLSRMSFDQSSKQAEIGARVARHYFNRAVWIENKIDLVVARKQLFAELGQSLAPPAYERTSTLGDIADELRTVGGLDQLLQAVRDDLPDPIPGPDLPTFSGDSFDLWVHHYEQFGNPAMADRLRSVRKVFNGLIDYGLPKPKIRILDHGVCGGLLQLQASTYYYRLRAAAVSVAAPSALAQNVLAGGWSPTFWWIGIVWGTAASALHNVQQMPDASELDTAWPGKLKLSDDPIAYLGILVDIMQEWNRYSVFKSLDREREPIQGIEVELGFERGKVVLLFKEPNAVDRAKKVRGGLNDSLEGWENLVEIRPPSPPRAT